MRIPRDKLNDTSVRPPRAHLLANASERSQGAGAAVAAALTRAPKLSFQLELDVTPLFDDRVDE